MAKAKAWGMQVYEQDWLITVWEKMAVTKSNVTAGSSWLQAMADAAASLDITIQYCMPLPRHMLESTYFQAVTNARASGDYHPGANNHDMCAHRAAPARCAQSATLTKPKPQNPTARPTTLNQPACSRASSTGPSASRRARSVSSPSSNSLPRARDRAPDNHPSSTIPG